MGSGALSLDATYHHAILFQLTNLKHFRISDKVLLLEADWIYFWQTED